MTSTRTILSLIAAVGAGLSCAMLAMAQPAITPAPSSESTKSPIAPTAEPSADQAAQNAAAEKAKQDRKKNRPHNSFDDPINDIPSELQGMDIVEKLGTKIPLDIEFRDHAGKPVKLADYFNNGKPVLLAMVYFRCPMLCKLVTSRLSDTVNELKGVKLGEQYNLVIVSFDPTDGPAAAKELRDGIIAGYPGELDANAKKGVAILTTPTPMEARTLADSIGFPYRYVPLTTEYAHSAAIFLLSPEGKLTRYLYGINYPTASVRTALIEAGEGKVGSSLERFMLWCFHKFDPATNSYAVVGSRVMTLGASFFGLIIFSGLGYFWYREIKHKRVRAMPLVSPVSGATSTNGFNASEAFPTTTSRPTGLSAGTVS